MSERCLICSKKLENGLEENHPRCSRAFFGIYPPPMLDLSLDDLKEYAATSVLARITVTGVQKKLSLGVEKQGGEMRFTIVGLWGNYILKPPVDEYPFLPENEDTVMRLAASIGIPTVPHAMIRLASGELSFISRRIDRDKKGRKIAMEDFCQLSGRLTEDKYKGSVERIGRLLRQYSVYPGLDAVDLFERAIFNFIVGNSDMHLKNYSLIETTEGMRLTPAYDFVSTALAIPDDTEESALTINGKNSGLDKRDFDVLGNNLGIAGSAMRKIYERAAGKREMMESLVKNSRLEGSMREALCTMIENRIGIFKG
ncbi:MAG: HipA domain-containing protein [Chitinispirillaceae bacterium]|nr:HipA domain-containing protein [Chitinispirillaceae bacterium]